MTVEECSFLVMKCPGSWLAGFLIQSLFDRTGLELWCACCAAGNRYGTALGASCCGMPRSGMVERSFGWLAHWGGLLRDRAGRLDVSAGRPAFVAILSGFQALLNPMPIRAA
ncbi:hypothetical protein [Rhodopila globiformis]|uniref:hypothetical protein n=1 Tax=Rhodopila globiformis TaxID=1071 RepID=UPI0011B0ED42|nr:hypothetical protein [Rhodopila globiformis]